MTPRCRYAVSRKHKHKFLAPTPALPKSVATWKDASRGTYMTNTPNEARFYPGDNLTGRSRDKATKKTKSWNITIPVTSDHPGPLLEL
jgi:hypothetical protein